MSRLGAMAVQRVSVPILLSSEDDELPEDIETVWHPRVNIKDNKQQNDSLINSETVPLTGWPDENDVILQGSGPRL